MPKITEDFVKLDTIRPGTLRCEKTKHTNEWT